MCCSGHTPSGTASPAATAVGRTPVSPTSGSGSSELTADSCRPRASSERPRGGVPVLLEVPDQLPAVVAEGLLATVDRHVLAEHIERLLADAHRLAVAGGAHHA